MFQEWKKMTCKPLKIIDILITMIVLGITVFLILYWKRIPEQVPQHWNFIGQIDNYADSGSYIMLVIMMYFFYAWHQISKLIPIFGWKENIFGNDLSKKISKETERKAYNILMGMLWFCDILVQVMFAYIILCGVFVRNLGVWFLPLMFFMMAADFIWFGVSITQVKNNAK